MSGNQWVFDQPHALSLTTARIRFVQSWLSELIEERELTTALDVGCGVGHFSRFLADQGLSVCGIDGRIDNVEEAKRRHGDVRFVVGEADHPRLRDLGAFDLVLCFGLLYHLENPLAALRNLRSVTRHVLVLETMIAPPHRGDAALVEEPDTPDQSLRGVALVPSEDSILRVLYRIGFAQVYKPSPLPDHPSFRGSLVRHRQRTMLAATNAPFLLDDGFFRLPEPSPGRPATPALWLRSLPRHLEKAGWYARQSWRVKLRVLRRKLTPRGGA